MEKLKNAYKDLTPDSSIARQTREIVTQSEAILNAWVEAATDAISNYNLQDGQKNNTPGGVWYSVRNTINGDFVAVVDDDILSGINLDKWNSETKRQAQKAASDALKKFSNGIVVDGITRKVNRITRREYTKSDYSEQLAKRNPTAFADKMRASSYMDDVVVATTNWARDGRLEHPRADNFADFDHGITLIMAGENKYRAEVVVGITNNGDAVLYDVVDMQPTEFTLKKEKSSTTATTNNTLGDIHEESSTNSIRFDLQNVNPKDALFSSRNVQQTKNLVALHNLTEDKLLKTLELGGFPMPSIAVTKADIPHTNFGEITVVFGRESIDPKANRKNTVYSADAWTPTVPQVEYEADGKATSRVYKQLSGLRNQVDDYFRQDLSYATYDTENAVQFVQNSEILYADKKRATSLLRSIGFYMPIELQQSGFVRNITYQEQNVNLYGESFSDVFVGMAMLPQISVEIHSFLCYNT